MSAAAQLARRRQPGRRRQILAVLVLSAIGAELLAAYDGTTGDPAAVAFAVVFFGCLYGAPVLLMRELARRRGWGWPSMLLLALALGVMQACVIDQSLFSTDYQDYEGFEESARATRVPGLGISAFNAYNFVLGHVIFSFCAPVAVVEAWRPERARTPWLGPWGCTAAAAAYLLAAGLIAADAESRSASPRQLVTSLAVVALAVIAAWWLGGRRRSGSEKQALGVGRLLGILFVLALVTGLGEETWTGLAVGLTGTALAGLVVLTQARRRGWGPAHVAAVGTAFLLVRGLLAFTYFPLIGEVDAVPKYAHNAVMLAAVILAGLRALRPGLRQRERAGPSLRHQQ